MSVAPSYANPIYPGDTTALRITITNSDPAAPVTGVAFTNAMPAALKVTGNGNTRYECVDGDGNTSAGMGTLTATLGSSTISLSGGAIPIAKASGASGKCDIDVEVTSTTVGVHTNTVAAGAVTADGALSNSTQAQQSITVNSLNLPVISKQFSSSTVVRNDEKVTLTITISNQSNATKNLPLNGLDDTPAYAVRDILPAGLQVAAAPNASSSCTGGGTAPAFSPNAGDTTLTAIGGTVAAGGTCTLTVDLIGADTGGAYRKNVTNTIDRNADFGNKRGLVPAANATATLGIVSSLQVTEQFTRSPVAAGQSSTLEITLTNASPISTITLTNYNDPQIDDVATAHGLTPTAVVNTCGGVSALVGAEGVSLTGGSIAPSSSCKLTITYQGSVQTAGTPIAYTNAIPEGAFGTTDADLYSQSATHSVTVVDQLIVEKARTPTQAAPGNPVRYTVTIRNYSGAPLSNVAFTDTLPAGMTALLSSPAAPALSGTGCTGLSHDIGTAPATPRFIIGTIPAGSGAAPASCAITFWAMTPANAATGSTFNNTIGAGTVTNDDGSGTITNSGSASGGNTTIASALTLSQIFNPASTFEGTVSQLTVTFTNLSAQPVTGMTFTDALPKNAGDLQLTIADPANASSTCAGAEITATPGSSTITMTGATVPARSSNGTGTNGTCTLKVNVIGPAGSYTNTLPAAAASGTQVFADSSTGTASTPGPVSASLTYLSALTAGKLFYPSTISTGGKSTVTIQLGNVGEGTLTNVSVTDPLPTNMTVATPPNAYTTCGGSPSVSAAAGAATVGMTGATIPANGKCNLLFDVIATGATNWTNTIPAGGVTASGGVQNVNAVSATLTNNSAGAITVTNNTNPNSLTAPGEVSVLTVTLNNTGTAALNGIALTNYFTTNGTAGGAQTGMVIAPTPNASTTCEGGIVNASADGTSVSLSGASLNNGATCTFSVNVTLRTTGTVQNMIPVGAITTSQGVSNTTATVTSLSASANIGVTKRFIPSVIKPGERSRLRLTFIHPVALPLTNLAATDNLPAGVTVPAGANPTTTCTGATVSSPSSGVVTVSGGSLPAAANGTASTCIAEIDVTAAVAGTYNNVIAIGGVTGTVGGGAANNPVQATATLEVRTPVTIAKSFNPNAVSPGVPSKLTITLTNPNNIPLTGAVLTDNLPSNLTVALTPNAATTCAGGVVKANASAISVVLTGATIPANGACTVDVDTVSNVAGVYINTIAAGNLATIQGVTNENPATDTVRVTDPPTVSKQFLPASIPSGGKSVLTIVLGNNNATNATLSAALVDTLPTSPGNIVVANPNNLTTTCPGAVTATAGAGTVTYANGAVIPPGGCTISVDVTGAANGVHANTIPAGGLKTTLGDNVLAANANLTISPLGSISGKVFKDNNATPNGSFEQGTDTPISGVTVTLTGNSLGSDGVVGGAGDAADTAVNLTTTTDALGNYTFTGLYAGTYTVSEPTQPANTNNGITTAGSIVGGGGGTAGTATAVAVTPSAITNITLGRNGAGEVASSLGNNFAEVVPSSISGIVFLDQNDNGVRNAADTGIAGVSIELLSADSTVLATAITDNAGEFSFTNLAPGTYSLREPVQPSDTANGKTVAGAAVAGGSAGTATAQNVLPSAITSIVLAPNAASTGNLFAEVPAGRQVSGRVFLDMNNDGVFNGSDSGIGSFTLNLTGTDFNGIPVSRTVSTTSDGRYVFAGLAAGTYTVTQPAQPGGTLNGITTAGSTGGVATAVAVTPSSIAGIDLTNTNTVSSENNFAEVQAPSAPSTGSIGGRVYVDLNDNGVIDNGDVGIPGVTVRLTGISTFGSNVDLIQVTGADGSYLFSDVQPSNGEGYTITETQPAAYADGKTTPAGANGQAVSVKPVASGNADVISKVVLHAGSALTGYNFGELSAGNSVSGFVYIDADDNGVKGAEEAGIAGVTVKLTGTSQSGAAVSLTTITGPDGSYSFTGLQPSNGAGYMITEVQPAAYADGRTTIASGNPGVAKSAKPVVSGGNDVIDAVAVVNGSALTNYNFGEKQARNRISGFVYVDTNDNGIRDSGEKPIEGVTVRLTGTTQSGVSVSMTTTTGADGSYSFNELLPSNSSGYTITEVQPAAYLDGRTTIATGNPGNATAAKPVAAGGDDRIQAVVLVNGAALADYNFGEKELRNSIAGRVYADRNNNGMREEDEDGIADVIVTLTGNDASGTAVTRTIKTGADGTFLFEGLPASSAAGYTLTETQPAKYKDGKTTVAAGNPGTPDSVKPATSGNIDRISAIVLPNGSTLTGYLYGEIPVPTLKPPIVNGYVWLDRSHNRVRPLDGSQQGMPGWTVQLRQNGIPVCTTHTDSNGFYQFDNLRCAGYEATGLPTGPGFSIVFSKEGSNLPAVPISGGGRGLVPSTGGQITNITLNANDEVVEQNLPLDPAGIVYDSLTRQPVKGAVVTISGPPGFDPATHLVGSTAAQIQTVGDDGLYQFLLQNDFPTGVYTLTVTAPAGYLPAPSTRLPVCNGVPVVGLFPTPALVQASDTAPAQSVTMQLDPAGCVGMVPGGARTTQYYFGFHITNGGSAPILNNHIPLDQIGAGSLVVSKTTPMVNVARGDLVPYTITATNIDQRAFTGVGMRDQMPPGFKYRAGSARRDGVPVEPVVTGRVLTWPGESYAPQEKHTYTLVLAVGAGVGDGDYVNQAYAVNGSGTQISNTGTATVRITPDPTFDCPDVIGKVFDDRNANGYQDDGEPGIPSVRVVTPRGLLVTTDADGRFHVPCADIQNADRGSNFVMKLDERTLPSGYRVTTENPRDVRITRGKMVKLNFGATIHRVARIELSDKAFNAGETTLRAEWSKQMDTMMEQLKTKPSVVRIAYRIEGDDSALVKKRVEGLKDEIRRRWEALDGMYTLAIEMEDAQ